MGDITKRFENLSMESEDHVLSNEEIEECLKVRNREYLIDKESPNIALQWVDILWAYLYDFRTTGFEQGYESTWNISKISATISCFADFKGMKIKDLLISLYRRSLIYPLYRNFQLCETITADLIKILAIGRKAVLKCLLAFKKVNEKRESGYLINRIFINDFIVWVQQAQDIMFQYALQELQDIKISKDDVDLGLGQVEEISMQCDWEGV